MAIHMEVEYAKRFEGAGGTSDLDADGRGSEGGDGDADGGGDSKEAKSSSPLPPKADVSWAHILAQNQVCPSVGSGYLGSARACFLKAGIEGLKARTMASVDHAGGRGGSPPFFFACAVLCLDMLMGCVVWFCDCAVGVQLA